MQKPKRDLRGTIRLLPFVLIWTLSLAAIGLLARAFTSIVLAPLLPSLQTTSIALLLGIILPGLVQVQIVERLLKRPMRGWMLYTLPGAFITLLLVNAARIVLSGAEGIDLYILLSVLAFIVPTPIIQAFWLRQHVRRAWLWPLTAILTSLAFAAFPSNGTNSHLLWLILTLIYGLIQSSVMHTVWIQTDDAEKVKLDFDSNEQSSLDQTRIERLQTTEHHRALASWISSDEPTAEQKRQ